MSAPTDVDVVVIGSGAGGLAAAVALARAGRSVLVLEQHTLPGGWCHSFDLGGFSFSPGVHYLGELGPEGRMRQLYRSLGVLDALQFEELDPDGIDQVHISDSFRFAVPKGREAYLTRLCETFPADAAGLRETFRLLFAMAEELEQFAIQPPPGVGGLFRSPTLIRYGLRSLASLVEPRVHDPRARAVLYTISGDHAMTPRTCPAVLHAAIFAHYAEGGWYPRGGGRSLPKAFIHELRRCGGQIRTGVRVARILVEGGQAIGVALEDGEELRAAHVVSNADPHATAALLPPDRLPWRWRLRLPRTRYSSAAVSLFLAAELDPEAHGLTSGNLWLLRDATAHDLPRYGWDDDADAPVPLAFLTCTTRKDPSKRRKPGIETFEAFAWVPWEVFSEWADTSPDDRPPAYEATKRAVADRVMRSLETRIPDLRERLVFEAVGTPLTNLHYVGATRGAIYGTEKSWTNMGPLGFGPRTPVPGLWMCGASTMGHGITPATLSGVDTAAAVLGITLYDIVQDGLSRAAAPPTPVREVARAR